MKIVALLLKYDYGIKERGDSLEKKAFFPALQSISKEVSVFWLEENGFWDDRAQLQKNILEFVRKENPNIVFFILMKDEITIDTIEQLSKKYITINWFCDDQWRFENFTKFIAPKLTYAITTDKFSLSKYKSINCKNVILSQWASFKFIENINFENINYKYDISFIGGKNSTREWIIKRLKIKGYKVQCFGYGWKNGRISFDKMQEIFLTSKINLNLTNSIIYDIRYWISNICNIRVLKDIILCKKNVEQIKARNFEIPCFGGFELTQFTPEIEDYYDIGKEVVAFSNIDDLEMQIKYYLNNEDRRKEITIKGYQRSKTYTYKEVLKEVFKKVSL